MTGKKKQQPQNTKFKEMAKELECNKDPKAFEDKLKKIAKPKEKPAK